MDDLVSKKKVLDILYLAANSISAVESSYKGTERAAIHKARVYFLQALRNIEAMPSEFNLDVVVEQLEEKRKMYAELAIEALEKQIPKKPKNIKVLGEPFFEDEVIVKYGDCAICGFDVHSDISEYCPNCGQKIDWSEADD